MIPAEVADKSRRLLPETGSVLLGALPDRARNRILGSGFEIDLPRGGMLYREGGAPRCALVRSGLIRVYMRSAEGRQVTVRYARPGDLLGIATAVVGPVPVGAQALIDSTLLAFDAALLAEEARRDGQIAWAVAQELGRRLSESLQQLAVNAFGSVRERVARHLLDAAVPGKQEHPVAAITQQDLADAVGSAREVVARVLRDLRNGGVVRTRPGGVVLLAPVALAAIASGEPASGPA